MVGDGDRDEPTLRLLVQFGEVLSPSGKIILVSHGRWVSGLGFSVVHSVVRRSWLGGIEFVHQETEGILCRLQQAGMLRR